MIRLLKLKLNQKRLEIYHGMKVLKKLLQMVEVKLKKQMLLKC